MNADSKVSNLPLICKTNSDEASQKIKALPNPTQGQENMDEPYEVLKCIQSYIPTSTRKHVP